MTMNAKLHTVLQSRWATLSGREQRLLGWGACVLLLATLWWVGIAPALQILKEAPAQQAALDAQWQHMQALQAEADAQVARGAEVLAGRDQDVVLAVEPAGQGAGVVHAADAPQLVGRAFVVHMANQGVAGVGGHGQHAALVEQLHGLLEQARLRVVGVNAEKLGHGGRQTRVGWVNT